MNAFDFSPRLEETAPEVHDRAPVGRAAYLLNDYRATGHPHHLMAAEEMTRRIASLWHTAAGTGRQTMWLQVARYAIELVACRNPRNLMLENDPRSGIFGDGIPLEEMAPHAHRDIIGAARHLAYHQRHDSPADYARASALAEQAAAVLQQQTRTGLPGVWLSVVRYLAELHAHTLVLNEARN
ncbi:hypothetical protein ACFYNX_27370 [Streptomyces sp. NPDC007872]|uniref:hypothetical protein n=1 Tax=Streptomyces sp. NPDC007872 TaxID=3364782 RepID=UPI00367EB0CC